MSLVTVATALAIEASTAAVGGGFSGLRSKIEQFNTELIVLGSVIAVTGFIWSLLGILIGVAGTAKAFTAIIVGTLIAFAPTILSFLTT